MRRAKEPRNAAGQQAIDGERRRLMKLAGAVALGGAIATLAPALPAAATRRPTISKRQSRDLVQFTGSDSVIQRMTSDLERALAKPVDQRKWAMVIDTRKCIGCSACTVACKAENKLPPGVVYRPVLDEEVGTYPTVSRRFTARPCMHCENPPCTSVCPVGATFKRADGIVAVNYDHCIGCRYCIAACPYGARTFDWGEDYTEGTPASPQPYERQPSQEYGVDWPRESGKSPIDNVRKCQFCVHRLEAHMLPACTTTCLGAATFFGDKNDPQSLVSELIGRPDVSQLKAELGTDPKVYYIT